MSVLMRDDDDTKLEVIGWGIPSHIVVGNCTETGEPCPECKGKTYSVEGEVNLLCFTCDAELERVGD